MRSVSILAFALVAGATTNTPTKPAAVTISVSPTTAEVRLGTPKDFNVSIGNTTNKTVMWKVNDIAGGNAAVGTINGEGLYTPPAALPSGGKVTVKAVSAADATKLATAAVTVLNPVPRIAELVPYNVNQGLAFTLVLKGTGFVRGAVIQWDATALATTFVSATELRASHTTNAVPSTLINVMAMNPAPGASSSNVKQARVLAPVSVDVWPDTRNLRGGASYDFGVSVSNTSDKAVTWFVNDVKGGNATVGTVDADGVYQAPGILPAGNAVDLKAASNADPRQSNTVKVTLLNPLPVLTQVSPSPVIAGLARTVALTGAGFTPTSKVAMDDTEVTAKFISPTRIDVTADVKFPLGGYSRLAVINPDPGTARSADFPVEVNPAGRAMSYAAAARFLEQSSWGPSPESIARLMEIGREAWIEEQFREALSFYPDPPNTDEGLSAMQKIFFKNAVTGKDQLRQRVAFALSQIFVVSGVDLSRYWQTVGFQRLMMSNAFGNYRPLMQEVTLNPAMGEYLDMVNNDKPNPAKNLVPNENYGRELMQLFTLGLFQLNPDGSRKTDSSGQPMLTYTEDHVKQLTLALTGWTYPPQPGFSSQWKNPSYYYGRMAPFQEHHDVSAKTILPGVILMPNQSAEQDLNDALNAIFNHPNLAPFVSFRMIQKLVTSNPSLQYVGRVTAAFNSPVKGDMKAMIRAILLDTEAGTGAAAVSALPANQGHLREPVLLATGLARALGATVTDEPSLAYSSELMGQKLFYSPSVFSYYSPLYRIPGVGANAPEFQILNPTTALSRVNFIYRLTGNSLTSTVKIPLAHFAGLASSPEILIKAACKALLRGAPQPDMEASILRAINTTTDKNTRARNALYLVATQSRYQVQR
jgi:hypothetical protein